MSVSIFFFFFTRRDLYLEACLAATDDRRSLGRSKEKKGKKISSRRLETSFLRSRKWIDSSNEFRNIDIIVHFYRGYVLCTGPIPWAYMGEIFPTKLKGTASTSAALFNWILAFIVTVSFSSVVDAVGIAPVFFFFALICALSVIFVIFLLVETKGKTFTEIQREFGTFEIEE